MRRETPTTHPLLTLVVLFVFFFSFCYYLQAFCDELETMIQDQLQKGKTPTSLLALQQIADFMTTSMPSMYPAAPQGGMAALNMSKQRGESVVCACVCVYVWYVFDKSFYCLRSR